MYTKVTHVARYAGCCWFVSKEKAILLSKAEELEEKLQVAISDGLNKRKRMLDHRRKRYVRFNIEFWLFRSAWLV